LSVGNINIKWVFILLPKHKLVVKVLSILCHSLPSLDPEIDRVAAIDRFVVLI